MTQITILEGGRWMSYNRDMWPNVMAKKFADYYKEYKITQIQENVYEADAGHREYTFYSARQGQRKSLIIALDRKLNVD